MEFLGIKRVIRTAMIAIVFAFGLTAYAADMQNTQVRQQGYVLVADAAEDELIAKARAERDKKNEEKAAQEAAKKAQEKKAAEEQKRVLKEFENICKRSDKLGWLIEDFKKYELNTLFSDAGARFEIVEQSPGEMRLEYSCYLVAQQDISAYTVQEMSKKSRHSGKEYWLHEHAPLVFGFRITNRDPDDPDTHKPLIKKGEVKEFSGGTLEFFKTVDGKWKQRK